MVWKYISKNKSFNSFLNKKKNHRSSMGERPASLVGRKLDQNQSTVWKYNFTFYNKVNKPKM
jgi:hypothetical protein